MWIKLSGDKVGTDRERARNLEGRLKYGEGMEGGGVRKVEGDTEGSEGMGMQVRGKRRVGEERGAQGREGALK